MAFTLPTAAQFKAYFTRDFPYAVPAVGAAAISHVTAGAVDAITATAPGTGYTEAPTVLLVPAAGGPGAGAAALAIVANGGLTGFTIVTPGAGYIDPPTVVLTGGAGDDTDEEKVMTSDIDKALFEAGANFNKELFPTQELCTVAFLYLTAHYLCADLLMAQQGLASKYNWLTQSKSVGNVSESFQIPQKVLDNPALSYYSTTQYGAKYLSIISPLLIGNMGTFFRRTLP